MKTRSFAVDLLLLASILLNTSCAAPTPIPSPTASQTPPATETPTPAATQTPAPTATETPVPAEFIPLNLKSTKFSETKEGVTTNIVLSMDASMKMRPVDEKADEFVKNTNFPGGSNEAMNAYARGFLYETAKLTNKNVENMTEEEYLKALAFAQENPSNEEAWKKVEINVYDDATKTTKNVRFTKEMTLDVVIADDKTEGLTRTSKDYNHGVRTESDESSKTLRIIRGFDSLGSEITSFIIAKYISDLPSLLGEYQGSPLKHKIEQNYSRSLFQRIHSGDGVCAFKLYLNGKPANTKEVLLNP